MTGQVLWDKQAETIVNNESGEILRQFDPVFADTFDAPTTLYPSDHPNEVDEIIDAINDGVYRAGLVKSQDAYERAVGMLFDALDRWDALLED